MEFSRPEYFSNLSLYSFLVLQLGHKLHEEGRHLTALLMPTWSLEQCWAPGGVFLHLEILYLLGAFNRLTCVIQNKV